MTEESGTHIVISKIIGLIIGLAVVFVLLYIINILFFPEGIKESNLPEFQYDKLVREINEVQSGRGKLITYTSTRDYMLVGFSKDINTINEIALTNECGKYPIIKDLEKPAICFGKGCLCLCEVDTYLAQEFRGDFIVDCESENIMCNAFEQSVTTTDECNYLMYYHTSKNSKDLFIGKNKEKIIIAPQP